MPFPALRSKRLLLRAFTLSDATKVQQLAGNYNVSRTTLNIPYPYENGMAETWINSHAPEWQAGTALVLAMENIKTEQQLMGAISLINITQHGAELGYWVGEPFWGQGYCTEAAESLLKYGMEELRLAEIYAEVIQSNLGSARVLQKIGMQLNRTIERADRDGRIIKVDIYSYRHE